MDEDDTLPASETAALKSMDDLWHRARTEPAAVLAEAGEAYAAFRKRAWKGAMAAALVVSGGARSFMSQLEEALRDLMEASALAAEASLPGQLARAKLRIASIFTQLGEYAAATEELDVCFEAARQAGDDLLAAGAYNNAGEISRELGRHEEALSGYARALSLARASGGHPGSFGIYIGNRGLVHHALGRFDDALRDYDEALALFRQYGNYPGLVELYCKRAELVAARGDDCEAENELNQALSLAVARNLRSCECDALIHLGQFYHARARLAEAETRLRRAVDIAREDRMRARVAKAVRALSRLAASCGEYRRAYIRLAIADRLDKALFNEGMERRMGALKVRNDLAWAEREASSAKSESAQHRKRVRDMERSYELLRLASRLGRDVTSELDLRQACRKLYEGLRLFMDAPGFFLAESGATEHGAAARGLKFILYVNEGVELESEREADSPGHGERASLAKRCFAEKRELLTRPSAMEAPEVKQY